MPIGTGTALLGATGLTAAGSALSGLLGSGAATQAAQIQATAAQHAADLQDQEFQQTQAQLAPFTGVGTSNVNPYQNALSNLTGSLPNTFVQPNISAPSPVTTSATMPNAFDAQHWGLGADQQAALAATPGYQFTLGQGLRGVQNSAAATGRGVSGNALAGAANYATGLANNTFNSQFGNALAGQGQNFTQNLTGQQQQYAQALTSEGQNFSQDLTGQGQAYGQLLTNATTPLAAFGNALTLGENAAARTGTLGQQAVANAGNLLTSGAAATAGGIVGSTNALTGGITGATSGISNLTLLNQLTGGRLFNTASG